MSDCSQLVRNYFVNLWQILTQPTLFFRQMPIQGGVGGPLCFALVTHWLGSSIAFIWNLLLGGGVSHYIKNFLKFTGNADTVDIIGREAQFVQMRDRILDWIFGTGSVILDPFLTLATILFTSFLVFIGARILISPGKNGRPEEISYESVARIICFGMTPTILAVFPFVGGFIATFYTFVITVIGVKEVYRVGTGRAVTIVLFPKLLFLGIILLGLLSLIMLFFKFIASIL